MLAEIGNLAQEPGVYIAIVLLLGLMAQWLAWRFRLPSILLLLIFGFLSGLLFDPDALLDEHLLFSIVAISVGVILFEGGLTLRFSELKEIGVPVLRLCTWGALVTWIGAGFAAWWIAALPWQIAILLGAILVVTGPTVIAPLLRHIKPQRRIGAVTKWEGIVIDPVGAVLAVLVLQGVLGGSVEHAALTAVLGILKTVVIGGGLALAVAWVLELFLRKHWLPDFLHTLAFLTCAACVFVLANHLQRESGLVAVTVLGVRLANQKSVSVRHVAEFKEHLRVLLISMLFIVLAARVDMASVSELGWRGIVFVIVLILLVRPISIFIATMRSGLTVPEKLFLCCMAPRGIVAAAVASVFALELSHALSGVEGAETLLAAADRLVPLTFLVIVGTVLIYGPLSGPVARKLKLAGANPQGILFAGTREWAVEAGKLLHEEGFRVLFVDTNHRALAPARMAGLPTCVANILSEYVREEMDLSGLGKLLAITPNDNVNSLAVMEFRQIFGRSDIFQLQPDAEADGKSTRHDPTSEIRGRILFPGKPTSWDLSARVKAGAKVKRTKITEEFSYEDFQKEYDGEALPLFIIRWSSDLYVCTDEMSDPEPGHTLISLVPEEDEPNENHEKPSEKP